MRTAARSLEIAELAVRWRDLSLTGLSLYVPLPLPAGQRLRLTADGDLSNLQLQAGTYGRSDKRYTGAAGILQANAGTA